MNALLLIDIQNDYFPGGSMELAGSVAAATNAANILSVFRRRHLPVFHVQHISTRPGASFFIPGTEGINIYSPVSPIDGEMVVTKNYPNSFRDSCLLEKLQELNPSRLFIAGMMTHMCVDTTVRAAFDLGFKCTVAHDACATKDLIFNGQKIHSTNVHASFMAALSGMFAEIVATDSACKQV
jgi:Amidases related to nicotinamidase